MTRSDTFIARCLRGAAVPAEIEAYVEDWHAGKRGQDLGLRDLLGLNPAEYGRWMRDPKAIFAIVSERRVASRQVGQLPLRAFPEIEQFRHAVADVRHHAEYVGQGPDNKPMYDSCRPKPVLTFRGTTKLHGTNAGAAFNILTGEVYAQSKERILSVEKDNFGFAAWLMAEDTAQDREQLRDAVLAASAGVVDQQIIACRVFGEWCGPKVNAKTAIGQLGQRWVMFSALVTLADGAEHWLSAERVAKAWRKMAQVREFVEALDETRDCTKPWLGPEEFAKAEDFLLTKSEKGEPTASKIHFISDYPQWSIDIDFNNPEAILDELERLTLQVEAECPVAKALGLSGMGEGIVWTYHDQLHGRLWFKTKGTEHKGTKNSRIVQIEPEVLASLEAFTEAVVTESRLEQGFELIRANHGTVNETHIGDFLKWVGQDVLKEESDTLEASGLERKQVMGRVNQRAKTWLMPRLART